MPRFSSFKMQRASRGFSLLEVLVAFVILSLVLGVLMEIFAGGLRNVGRAGETQHAVLLAQSKLAAVGIELPLAQGDTSGEFEQDSSSQSDLKYRWQISIKPYIDTQPAAPSEPVPDAQGIAPTSQPVPILPVELLEVEVRVSWGDTDQPRSVSLKTIRLANKAVL